MNSAQAYKGFVTFVVVGVVLFAIAFGFRKAYLSTIGKVRTAFNDIGSPNSTPSTPDTAGIRTVKSQVVSSDNMDFDGFAGVNRKGSIAGVSTENTESNIIDNQNASDKKPTPLFLGLVQNKATLSSDDSTDYGGLSGFKSDAKVKDESQTIENMLDSRISEMISAEFRDALLFGDTRYDFDGNGEVTSKDYPLFIEFILNPED